MKFKGTIIFVFVVIILLFFTFHSFTEKESTNVTAEINILNTNPVVKSDLAVFIEEFIDSSKSCKNCIFEMIVDKKDPEQTTIGLRCYSADVVPFKDKLALPFMSLKINNTDFRVYNGFEEIFEDYKITEKNFQEIAKQNFFKYWCIVLERDTSFLIKEGCIDFMPFHLKPTIIFQDIDEKN